MAFWDKDKRAEKKAKKMKRIEKQGLIAGVTQQATPQQAAGTNKPATMYQYGYGYQAQPAIATPTDTKDVTKLSVLLLRQSTLNNISAICQPVAGGSEFQVHYRALVVRIKNENREFILSIPTAFYNFEQKVASASVDYHLDNVEKAAAVAKPISDLVIKEIFKEMPLLGMLKDMYDGIAEVTYEEVNSGSMHRHPGRFGFSGTDYTKNPRNPGVIYREAEATDKVHTDSVLYLGTRTEIYTTETRILNLKPVGEGVEGTYCQIPTTTYLLNDVTSETEIKDTTPTLTELLGNLTSELKDSSGDFYITNAMGANSSYELVMELIEAFKNMNVLPDISGVSPSHITSYGYGGNYRTVYYGHGLTSTVNTQKSATKGAGKGATAGKSYCYEDYLDGIDSLDDDYLDDGYDYRWAGVHRNPTVAQGNTTKAEAQEYPEAEGNPYVKNSVYWVAYNKAAFNGKH